MGDELVEKMILEFISEQQKFNLTVIDRISKAETKIYFAIFGVSSIISTLASIAVHFITK
jgi:uncharacterized membrane protein